MPSDTFFNLPEEKKERVIEAAVDEFSSYSFHKASVTRIIKKAGIASGSFYQYFGDKKDLYVYVIKLAGEKKLKYMNTIQDKLDQLPFFELLREIYLSGIRFAKENPRLEAIGNKLLNEDEKLFNEIIGEQKPEAVQFMVGLLQKGVDRGEIDSAIDTYLVAHLLISLSFSLAEIIYEDGVVNIDDMVVIDKMLYIIKNGIKNH